MLEHTGSTPIEAPRLADLPPPSLAALRFALYRTNGVMIYAARPRHIGVLGAFRAYCRQSCPAESRYDRFDLLDVVAEDVRGLLKVALKGDVVDVGLASANGFEALRVLAALGVPPMLLGSPYFWAGIVHLQPVVGIARRESSIELVCSEHDALSRRVQMAFGGTVHGARLRAADDSGTIRWYADVVLPDIELCSLLERGAYQEAWEYWCKMSDDLGGCRAARSALDDVAQGLVDPRDFERAFGPIHWEHAMRDRMLQGFEII